MSAFFGGGGGVLGTVLFMEWKKVKVMKDKQCAYCSGGGSITCGICLGTGALVGGGVGAAALATQTCPGCEGVGSVSCVNCKGTGRMTPLFLDSRLSRDPETEMEDVGIL